MYSDKQDICTVIWTKYEIINLYHEYTWLFIEYVERYKYFGMYVHVRNDVFDNTTIDNKAIILLRTFCNF